MISEFKNPSMVELIKREMKDYSQVHFVKCDLDCIFFYCSFLTFSNLGMKNILRALPLCKVRIIDGLLAFDLSNYGGC